MRCLLGFVCLISAFGVVACGGDDDDDSGAGKGGSAAGSSQANAGSGGRAGGTGGADNRGSGGTGAGSGGTGSGSGGMNGSGGMPGSAGIGGGGTGGSTIDVNSPTARTAACIEYIRGFCTSISCGSTTEPPAVVEDRILSCLWQSATNCPDVIFATGSTRTVEGTIACAQDWGEFSCADRARGLSPACATAGTLPVGAKCISTFQCASRGCRASGMLCDTCRAVVGPGETCDDMHGCPPGYSCPTGTCEEIPEQSDAGTPQSSDGKLGDPCDSSLGMNCDPKFNCQTDPNGTTSAGHCVEYPHLGDDCSIERWCEPGDSYCDLSLKCLLPPTDGNPCGKDAWTGEAVWCADGTFCDTAVDPPLCRTSPSGGAPCSGACAAGFTCMIDEADPNATHCFRRRMPGDSCTEPGDLCLPGATKCEGGVCVMVEWQGLYESMCMP